MRVDELIRRPIPKFSELSKKREEVSMGDYTNVIGDFYEKLELLVDGPGLNSIARVISRRRDEEALAHAKTTFDKFFDVSEMKWYGQGFFGFEFNVADLTPDDYADLLEKAYHFLTLTRK